MSNDTTSEVDVAEVSIQQLPSQQSTFVREGSPSSSQQCTTSSQQSHGPLLSDISEYINKSVEDSLKFQILKEDWSPKPGTTFPLSQFGPKKRSFQRQWLAEYPGLVYSQKTDGILCIFCSMFPCDSDGKRGALVKSVYSNWKHAKEKCNEHFFGARVANRMVEPGTRHISTVVTEQKIHGLYGEKYKHCSPDGYRPEETTGEQHGYS